MDIRDEELIRLIEESRPGGVRPEFPFPLLSVPVRAPEDVRVIWGVTPAEPDTPTIIEAS